MLNRSPPSQHPAWLIGVCATVAATIASVALRDWLLFVLIFWGIQATAGIVPFRKSSSRSIAIQWGLFIGVSLGLAIIVWGPAGVSAMWQA